jgi:hypothetical protein
MFFQWDDKITTLPGLYLFSVGVLNPFAQAWNAFSSGGNSSSSEAAPLAKLCTTSTLRAVNVVLSALTFVIGHWIVVQIHGGKHVRLFMYTRTRPIVPIFTTITCRIRRKL